jgi:hypothetical protein
MRFPHKLFPISVLSLVLAPLLHAGSQTVVQKIDVITGDPLQLQVETTSRVTPQAQVITAPDRLVIDVPGAVPASTLRNKSVNQSEVERVRVALFSSAPPVTRIVLDLNSPQWYRIAPTASGFTVTLGASDPSENASATEQLIGWVSGQTPVTSVPARRDPFIVSKSTPDPLAPVSAVRIQFAHDLLEIHSHDAPLSEVLFQIQKQTGAEIAIPPGAGQERIVADLGPAAPSEVLAQLFNGSDYNFVVMGSATDPNSLGKIILTEKSPGFPQYAPSDAQPPVAANSQADNADIQPQVEPLPEDVPPSADAPPQDVPSN